MAGQVRYLLNQDARYFVRLTVHRNQRRLLDGRSELRTPRAIPGHNNGLVTIKPSVKLSLRQQHKAAKSK